MALARSPTGPGEVGAEFGDGRIAEMNRRRRSTASHCSGCPPRCSGGDVTVRETERGIRGGGLRPLGGPGAVRVCTAVVATASRGAVPWAVVLVGAVGKASARARQSTLP